MPGVMERARQRMPQGDGRTWIDAIKDHLIHDAIPLAIVDINYDSVGSGKFPKPRWIVAIEPWFEEDDADDKISGGKLSFGAGSRDPQFEDLQDQLEELEKEVGVGNAELGPVCLIKGQAKTSGNRFYTFADYDEVKGEPILPELDRPAQDSNGQATSGRRRPVHGDAAAPVEHSRASTGQRRRRAERTQEPAPAAEGPSPAGEPAPEQSQAEEASSGTRRRRTRSAEAAAPTGESTPTGAAPVASDGSGAKMGFAHCDDCGQDFGPAKVYPKEDGSGDYVLVHSKCEKTGKMALLTATVT